jgi:hypothetical protein
MEHRRWCAEKLLSGWRPLPRTAENTLKWKEDKSSFKRQKLHLDLVPYDELNPHDQGKDISQINGIPSFLKALGKDIRRTADNPSLLLAPKA